MILRMTDRFGSLKADLQWKDLRVRPRIGLPREPLRRESQFPLSGEKYIAIFT